MATPSKKSDGEGAKASGDSGAAEVQAAFDEAADKGFFGSTPDDTPNENYSLQTPQDAPTPETQRGVNDPLPHGQR